MIKDIIINEMPKGLTDLEKARYLYLRLNLMFSFSTKFQNTDQGEFARMYVDLGKDTIKTHHSNQLICKNWVNFYSELLNEVNIKNEVVNVGHSYVSFYIDNVRWIADGTDGSPSDLSRVRYGMNTNKFGEALYKDKPDIGPVIKESEKLDSLLDEIDSKFSFYYDTKKEYKKILGEIGRIKSMDSDVVSKLNDFFDLIGTLKKGYYESKDYVYYLERILLTEEERNQVSSTELLRTNSDKEVDIIQCIYVKRGDNQYNYYLLAPNFKVIKNVPKEVILKLSDYGFGIGKKEIPGIDYPNKFNAGVKSKRKIKYRKLFGKTEFLDLFTERQEKRI